MATTKLRSPRCGLLVALVSADAGVSSTTGFTDLIDHHLASNEAFVTLVASSTEVYRLEQQVANYATTTSDHFPVLSRYSFQ